MRLGSILGTGIFVSIQAAEGRVMRRLWVLLLLPGFVSCSGQSLDGVPLAQWAPAKTVFFVEPQPADTHNLIEGSA
jgi:hypothetical protein